MIDSEILKALFDLSSLAIALFAAVVPLLAGWAYQRFTAQTEKWESFRGWINALFIEIEHERRTLTQINGVLHSPSAPTKRFNDDLFAAGKSELISFERAPNFFGQLTRAYRDLKHTNAMLDRLESYREAHPTQTDEGIREPCKKCMGGVTDSLNALHDALTVEQTNLESWRPMPFWRSFIEENATRHCNCGRPVV